MSILRQLTVRVISLSSSQNRRLEVSRNLEGSAFSWEFFNGLTSASESCLEVRPDRQITRYGRLMTPGEIGCFKSHFSLLTAFAKDLTLQWLLVLEDDVWVDTSFQYSDVIKLLEARNISYCRLFARRFKPADVVVQLGQHQLIRFRTDPYGTQAYLISRAGAESFVRSVRSVDMPIDDELGRFWRHGLDPYAIFPFPVIERSTKSTLQDERVMIPMNVRAFTFRRHMNGLFEKIMKTAVNYAFRFGSTRV